MEAAQVSCVEPSQPSGETLADVTTWSGIYPIGRMEEPCLTMSD